MGYYHDEADELVSYAGNDWDLHRQSYLPVEVNLNKKVASGTYDSAKAEKLWGHYADRAAQKYTKDFGGTGHGSYGIYSPEMRKKAAKRFAKEYENTVRYSGSVPAELKKHQIEYGDDVPVDDKLRPIRANKQGLRTGYIGDVKQRAEAAGSHYFETGTMRFFKSKVYDETYIAKDGTTFFVTSEQAQGGVRSYSVRVMTKDDHITTAGDFQAYDTLAQARSAAKALAKQGPPKSSPKMPRQGPGSGWWNERLRHREAARKGRRRR